MPANYDNVNAAWPDNPAMPTGQEALAGARKLVKLALSFGPAPPSCWEGRRHKFRGEFKLTSGNRYTWTRRGVFYVNPARHEWNVGNGWQTIVHNIAHWAGHRLYPGANPHDHRTAFIERKLAEHVVKNGWLEGKLKRPAKPKIKTDIRRERYESTLMAIARLRTKLKRTQTILRKLEKRRKYYERELAE